MSAREIQCWWRRVQIRRNHYATKMSSFWRGYLVRRGVYMRAMIVFSACLQLQSLARGRATRQELSKWERGAVCLQAAWRKRSQRKRFLTLRGLVSTLQRKIRIARCRLYFQRVLRDLMTEVARRNAARRQKMLVFWRIVSCASSSLAALLRSRNRIQYSHKIRKMGRGWLAVLALTRLKNMPEFKELCLATSADNPECHPTESVISVLDLLEEANIDITDSN